jgi:glyoxylase-like metal-dependent hydrolase (beta-lactamase superfamily II)
MSRSSPISRATCRSSSTRTDGRGRGGASAGATRSAAGVVAVAAFVASAALAPSCVVARELSARVYHVQARLNPAPTDRRTLPGGIESVCSRGSITWIVPTGDGGVVLIDTGYDDQARAIRHVLKGRKVHAILLTHGHLDHAAGTATLDAPVWVGRADAPALRGQPVFRSLYPRLGEFLAGVPTARGPVHEVSGGEVLRFGDRTFTAIATPGHTDGSTSWLLDDILFAGDAIQRPTGDALYPAPPGFTASVVAAYDSMRRLRDVPLRFVADAHYGFVDDAPARLAQAVRRAHDEVALRDHPPVRPTGCADDPVAW